MSKPLKLILFCLAILMSATLGSCGSSRSTTVRGSDARVRVDNNKKPNPTSQTKKTKSGHHGKKATNDVASALVNEARTWIGTPYSYGGKSRQGTDCSGFVMEVYKTVTGIDIPRNSSAQNDYCEYLDRDELEVGDLVFFSSKKSGGKIAHVGLYIGDGTMIHASSSKGVIESSLSQNYYIEHYVGAGRVPAIAQAVPPRRSKKPIKVPVIVPAEREPEKDNLAMEKVSPKQSEKTVVPKTEIALAEEPVTSVVVEPVRVTEPVAPEEPVGVSVTQTQPSSPTVSPTSVVKNAFSASVRR